MTFLRVFKDNIAVSFKWRIQGFELIDSNEKFIAPVTDLLYDKEAGRVRWVMAEMGGFMAIKGKELLIPVEMLETGNSGTLIVAVTIEYMIDSPVVEHFDNPGREYEEELYRYYQLKPYWEREEGLDHQIKIEGEEENKSLDASSIKTDGLDMEGKDDKQD